MSLIPDFFFNHISSIPVEFFSLHGLSLVLLDIDNTLTDDQSPVVSETVIRWLREVERYGTRLAVVSNNHAQRVNAFSEKISIPVAACRAGKPSQKCVPKILAHYSVISDDVAVIGDQLFTDIWFAKRMGAVSILIQPSGPDLIFGVKLKRLLERPLLRSYERKGLLLRGNKHE